MRRRTAVRVAVATALTTLLAASGGASSHAVAQRPDLADEHAAAEHVMPRSIDMPAVCTQQRNIICISQAARTLTYLENGRERLSAQVRFGRPGFETPTGTWKITTKDAAVWWSYPYKVFMPWGMVFDPKVGLYIHYSSGFALNPKTYVGSHGCVQLGDWETARLLYQRAPAGTTVHIY